MRYELCGKVEISKFNSSPEIDILANKYSKGTITPDEFKLLKPQRTSKTVQNNMLMNRFFDRLASAFTQAEDKFAELASWQGIDWYSNQNSSYMVGTTVGAGATATVPAWIPENVPGLIGCGWGATSLPLAASNVGLYDPFPHSALGGGPYNYRNTWNSKEQGSAPKSTSRDYTVLRCGAFWDDAWESRDALLNLRDIDEIGLFMNQIYISRRVWAGPALNPTIDFTGGVPPPSNKAHDILNITTYKLFGGLHKVEVLNRSDIAPPATLNYSWDETAQQIRFIGGVGFEPTVGQDALMAFTPRYDHSTDAISGSLNTFSQPAGEGVGLIPRMLARVILPEPFQKVNTETMTIVWILYWKRVT